MRSLRAREFAAIAVTAIAVVAVSLVVAAILVRRSVKHEALRALARQVALTVEQERAKPSSSQQLLGEFFETQQEKLSILSIPQAAALLPPAGGSALNAGRPAQGSVDVGGNRYLYATQPVGTNAIVLLRSAELEASDRRPFTVAFVIAAATGAGIAAIAAFLLADAVTRPIGRVALASRRLAAGETHDPLPVGGSTEVASLAVAFNQMAEDLDRARDADRSFLLSVSHELKTPLASIRGHGEALLDQVVDVPKGAGVVVQEAKRLERLVRDLLDLARLNQRAFSITPQHVNLAVTAAEAVARHESDADRVSVSLVAETPGDAPATADPDRVLQVLSNLIENALRSTAAGGRVTVSAGPGELRVADTGPGLAADDLPRAFERFYLHGRYGTNRAVGTGLGLAIVKELTEAMDGSVRVESSVGHGTTFVVSLPAAPAGGEAYGATAR